MDGGSGWRRSAGTLLHVDSDRNLPLVFTYAQALRHGLSRHQITRRARNGRWHRWHRGVYSVSDTMEHLSARQHDMAAAAALLLARGKDDAASHLSAAALHGWLLPLAGAGKPTVTSPSGTTCCRRRSAMVVQVAGLPPSDVMLRTFSLDGGGPELPDRLRCTRPARTLADLLRHLPMPDSLAIGDDVLRRGVVSYEEVARAVDRQRDWPYAERAHQGLPLLDPRHESWLESFSFTTLHLAGLERPEPQVTVHDGDGRLVGRVDGWLDDVAVALEPDGKTKYLSDLGPPSAEVVAAAANGDSSQMIETVSAHVRQVLLRQNDRQRRLEALGVTVVRWGTHDIVARPQWVLAQILRARRDGATRRFTGTVTRQPTPSWRA